MRKKRYSTPGSCLSGLLLMLLTTGLRMAWAQVTFDVDPTFGQHGVHVITYTSPEFQPTLTRLAGQQLAAEATKLQPYMLIIKNTASSPLAEVVVRYPRNNTMGKIIEGVNRSLIPKGSPQTEFVLAPYGSVSQVLNASRKVPVPGFQTMVERLFGTNFDQTAFPQAAVSLDAVIFADGGVIGPDRAGTVALVKAMAEARAQMLTRLEDVSQPDDQVIQWLTDLSTAPAREISPQHPDLVQDDKSTLARTLLQLITGHGGRAATTQWLKSALANHGPEASTLHRLD